MKYAVIETGGKQYKITEGAVIEVEQLADAEPGKEIIFEKILLYTDEDGVKIGTPALTDVAVVAKILENVKGKKIRVGKFKAKARFRRVQGHRQHLTRIQIARIGHTKETKKETSQEAKPRAKKA